MSLFATKLKALLDDTCVFNRRAWTQILFISQETIEKWLRDEELPRGDQLHMIVHAFDPLNEVNEEPIKEFFQMAELPARHVSPLGEQMLPTVREYMDRPVSSALASVLARKDPISRAEYLNQLYPA